MCVCVNIYKLGENHPACSMLDLEASKTKPIRRTRKIPAHEWQTQADSNARPILISLKLDMYMITLAYNTYIIPDEDYILK